MWHIKHEIDTIVFSETRVVEYERPYLENDDGVRIRRIGGGGVIPFKFEYRGSLGSETVSFTFDAFVRDWKDESIREYNVDLVHSLFRLPRLDGYSVEESAAIIRLVMDNIREALTNFPEPVPIGPKIPPAIPKACRVKFTASLSPRWDRYQRFFTEESVV